MAQFGWHVLDTIAYQDNRFNFITTVEEAGAPKTKAYIDSVGIPTIGIGFNLRAPETFQEAVSGLFYPGANIEQFLPADAAYTTKIRSIVNATWRAGDEKRLGVQLDAVMKARAQDPSVSFTNKRSGFAYANAGEIKLVFNKLAAKFEDEIDRWHASIPGSSERVSLFSLAWNAFSLLGQDLKNSIATENRSEAWYQMRYGSNNGLNGAAGLAKRRYFESQFFNLYNPGKLDQPEAEAILKTMTAHQDFITAYDAKFGSMVARSVSDYRAPVQTTGQTITPVKSFLSATPPPPMV